MCVNSIGALITTKYTLQTATFQRFVSPDNEFVGLTHIDRSPKCVVSVSQHVMALLYMF